MEIVITTDLASFPKLIEFNYEELKTTLHNSLEKYRGIAYTDDQIQAAKADRATLNKLKAAIDAERKNMKAICLQPFNDFESKTKELIALVDEPVKEIDDQVKKFELAKKEEKKATIRAFFDENAAEISGLVPFDSVFDEKWLNSSTSMKAVQDVILKTVARIQKDLATIDSFGGELALNCKDVYLRTLNLSDALAEKTRLEELKARIEAEEARKKQEAEQVKPELEPEPVAEKISNTEQESVIEEEPDVQSEPVYTLSFRVIDATREQLAALKNFLETNNFVFERV